MSEKEEVKTIIIKVEQADGEVYLHSVDAANVITKVTIDGEPLDEILFNAKRTKNRKGVIA